MMSKSTFCFHLYRSTLRVVMLAGLVLPFMAFSSVYAEEQSQIRSAIPVVETVSSEDSICGQMLWTTSCNGRSIIPVLFTCESEAVTSNTPHLWQPLTSGFQPDAYYRIYGSVFEPIDPKCTDYHGEITSQLAAWSRYEEIASCEECGASPPTTPTPTAMADLSVSDIQWESTPEAFERFSLFVTVQNRQHVQEFTPTNGHFQLEVKFIERLGDEISFFFDSESSLNAHRLSPITIPPLDPGETTVLEISDLIFPTAMSNGAVEVNLIPKDEDPNLSNNRRVESITIVGPPILDSWRCFGVATFFIGGSILSFAERGLTEVAKNEASEVVIEKAAKIGTCSINDDVRCAENELQEMVELAHPENIFDLIAFIIEALGGAIEDVAGCSLLTLEFLLELAVPSTPTPTRAIATETATTVGAHGAIVKISALNVRSGPGRDYSRLGSVRSGDELDVIGQARSCDWLKVITPTGIRGWVSGHSQYVTLNLACDSIPEVLIPTIKPTPVQTSQPIATPVPSPSERFRVVTDFEIWGNWQRGDEPWGTFTQSKEQVYDGYSGKFEYSFPAGEKANYLVYRRTIPISGEPNALQMWVYGDGSNNILNAWIQDATGQIWQFTFGRINFVGQWHMMHASFDLNAGWPNEPVGGNPNASNIVYPIKFYALVVDGHREDITHQGTIYVDELFSGDSDSFQPEPTAAPIATNTPTPSGDVSVPSNPGSVAPTISFYADSTQIRGGECTTLRWDVENVKEVYLGDHGAAIHGVAGQSSQQVCPHETFSYDLRIVTVELQQIIKTVTVQVVGAPEKNPTPSNPYPADGATVQGTSVTLSWSGGDPDGDEVRSKVYVAGQIKCDMTTATSCYVTDLASGQWYEWQIWSWDEDEELSVGPTWTFTVEEAQINRPPNTPFNPSPEVAGPVANTSLTLRWSGGDPDDGDAVTYDVYIENAKICEGISVTSCYIDYLVPDQPYHWRVVAIDKHGSRAESPDWWFLALVEFVP